MVFEILKSIKGKNPAPHQLDSNSQLKVSDCQNVKGIKLHFEGVPNNRDVYNISAPFNYQGRTYLAGRVESRQAQDSISGFFRRTQPGIYNFCSEFPFYKLEDPFFTWVGDTFIFGGVEIEKKGESLSYRTLFHRGSGPDDLEDEPFAKGPENMKDIRIKQLPDGHIIVFTRPQGFIGGRGKIGITMLDSLEELKPGVLDNATLLYTGIGQDDWGGVNEIHVLDDQWLGLLAHQAEFRDCNNDGNDDCRRYVATTFKYNWKTGQVTQMKKIASREQFPTGPSKRPDLEDVIFAGGIVRRDDGMAELYCGLSDTEAGYLVIPDPFND
jgi:hypothetical protein